jgi:photosynthetic reaction center H subunit
MHAGAVTNYIDVAQLTLYAFWIFFFGLIYYLRREDKREGYPLISGSTGEPIRSFPPVPSPKVFLLSEGSTQIAPRVDPPEPAFSAKRPTPWPGMPLSPVGNPLLSGAGPAAWVHRHDVPDLTVDGHVKIVPLRVATDYHIEPEDPDPRGYKVVGGDGKIAGTIKDVWVDRAEVMVRYLEVDVATASGHRAVLVPSTLIRVDAKRRLVKVTSILAGQFAEVPGTKNPDQVTFREEDQITAYYGAGHLYAKPSRLGPIL